MQKREYDAVVVGAGPNGLAAAITLQQQGLSVLLLEARSAIGGGMRSIECTLPGFLHDVCSAIHPMAVASPFFHALPLENYGVQFIYPELPAAHPLDDGTAALLYHTIDKTAAQAPADSRAYQQLMQPLLARWHQIVPAILGPLRPTRHLASLLRFGLPAILPATILARRRFSTRPMQALLAGMAAHAVMPLSRPGTSAIALVLMMAAHYKGWPLVKGGTQQLAHALGSYFQSLGGTIQTGCTVTSLQQLPGAHAVLLDVTPQQLLVIAGHRLSSLYRWQLSRYTYGMGVHKVDWALAEPVPFTALPCRRAGTVHLGGTLEEIAHQEQLTYAGRHPENPFVLLAQPSLFDITRAPAGQHTLWAYCHTPNGSTVDRTDHIEKQVERFAPGFRERILARHTMTTAELESYNANYIGGDVLGGEQKLSQLFTRPALRASPYRTSAKGIYLCSASTPPGGGVHGMSGYYAARRALKDIFQRT